MKYIVKFRPHGTINEEFLPDSHYIEHGDALALEALLQHQDRLTVVLPEDAIP